MQIIRALGRYAKDNGGAVAATRKVARLAWVLLRTRGAPALAREIRTTLKTRRAQVALLARKKILASLARNKELVILTTPHAMYVAHMLTHQLSPLGFRVSIATSPPLMGYGEQIYIVICPQMFARLPKHMIAFQMEQSTSPRWFTRNYLKMLRAALATLDYSRTNIEFLTKQGVPYQNLFYLPITTVPDYLGFLSTRGVNLDSSGSKNCDVLFYGDVNNERRRAILAKLSERFQVTVVSNLFGPELYERLLKARVILNIHYYENALLETTRICECLSLGVPVVSENSADQAEYPELASRVHFVNVGDVAAMAEAIDAVLNSDGVHSAAGSQPHQVGDPPVRNSHFYLNRFMLAYGLADFETASKGDVLPPRFTTGRICLSLPETTSRRASFLLKKLAGYEIFDGLRSAQGWIGCGLSYKYLLKRAKMASIPQVLICEDDVVLTAESESAIAVVNDYLKSLNGEWDIFVGVISHLHPNANISRVDDFGGLTFVHLDRMTGMVCNIYNHSIYDLLMSWDESNEDPKTNTIDRYLESTKQLRVVTAVPYIAGHSENDSSTLWGFGNDQYVEWIERSSDLLQRKVRAFSESRASSPDAR